MPGGIVLASDIIGRVLQQSRALLRARQLNLACDPEARLVGETYKETAGPDHRLMHEKGCSIQMGASDKIPFTLPDGRELKNNYHGRFRGNVIELKSQNRQNGLEIDHHTAVPDLDEGPLDYGMAMVGLVQREW